MGAAVLTAALWLSPGCADFQRGEPSPDAGSPPGDGAGADGGSSISYASGVHPLLASGCQSCHRGGGSAGDTGFVMTGDAETDYPEALSLTDTSSPAASRLLRKGSGAGHGGGAIYAQGTAEYQTLLAWVAGGARP
jgi:predicted outer membrane repeat protein